MKILNPFTYLLFPFSFENSQQFHITSSSLWSQGKVLTNNIDNKYRNGMAYSFIQHYFKLFVGGQTEGGVDNILFMSLDDTEKLCDNWLEECLCFKNPKDGNTIEFGICYKQNSFDTIKLLVNPSTGVGLLVIPISVRANIDEFRDFIYFIRQTALNSIWKKGEEESKKWSLNSIISTLMKEFEGKYTRFNKELALHLSFLITDSTSVDEHMKEVIVSMTRGDLLNVVNGNEYLGLIESSNSLYIASSIEGTVILTLTNWGKAQNTEKETVLQYRMEQTERYMIYLLIVMQRYSLIKVVQELSEIRNLMSSSNRKALAALREKTKAVSLIRLENYFSIISDYSVYNEFYQVCCSSFGINKLYNEIEQKMSVLNSYLTQQSEDRRETADWHISIILAILTVLSATNDVYQLFSKGLKQPWLVLLVVIFFIIITTFLFNTILKNIRR